jgi:hypothetical protein
VERGRMSVDLPHESRPCMQFRLLESRATSDHASHKGPAQYVRHYEPCPLLQASLRRTCGPYLGFNR